MGSILESPYLGKLLYEPLSKLLLYEPLSKILVSPVITSIVVPYPVYGVQTIVHMGNTYRTHKRKFHCRHQALHHVSYSLDLKPKTLNPKTLSRSVDYSTYMTVSPKKGTPKYYKSLLLEPPKWYPSFWETLNPKP